MTFENLLYLAAGVFFMLILMAVSHGVDLLCEKLKELGLEIEIGD